MPKFLIIRLSSRGDIIHTLPAFAALRRRFPDAHISWVVSPAGRPILELVPGLDEIIEVGEDEWTGRLRDRERVALDFQDLFKSGLMARRSRARRRLGFGRRNLREPLARFFYTERLSEISEDGHVVLKNLKLLQLLEIEETRFEFPLAVPNGFREDVRRKVAGLGRRPDRKLVVLNVGAAWPTKRWFPERWAAVAGRLDRKKYFPVLLWGNEDEHRLAEDVGRASGTALVPFLGIPEVLALLQESALLVSGDTFALQAACALGIPVVAIFGPTSPGRNGPFAAGDKIAYHEIACSRCYKRTCDSLACLKAVTAEEVAGLVRDALAEDA
jgi:lipopolysaccharide heptosyltransferase I